jgi:hypothetical protein
MYLQKSYCGISKNNKTMKAQNIIWGSFWIVLGVLFLGDYNSWFSVEWHRIFSLWPVLLIVMGLLMFFGKTSRTSVVVAVIAVVLSIPAMIVGKIIHKIEDKIEAKSGWNFKFDDDYNNDDDNDDTSSSTAVGQRQTFSEAMATGIQTASLKLEGGAAKYIIENNPTSELISVEAKSDIASFTLKKKDDGSNTDLAFTMKDRHGRNNIHIDDEDWKSNTEARLRLNPNVAWDVDVDFGAGKGEFDLSGYKVTKLDVDAGAAALDIKLGDKADNLDVKIDSGVSGIEVEVPTGVGVRIDSDTFLAEQKFEGFTDKGRYYESENYDSAKKKIAIRFNGALASFKVKRY